MKYCHLSASLPGVGYEYDLGKADICVFTQCQSVNPRETSFLLPKLLPSLDDLQVALPSNESLCHCNFLLETNELYSVSTQVTDRETPLC